MGKRVGKGNLCVSFESCWAELIIREVGHPAPNNKELAANIPLLAAYGASTFNRTVSKRGFEKKGRSMVTGDLVEMVGEVYEEVFGKAKQDDGTGSKL
jgi:ATP-dependent NAD(P)H-hydrate dehydratase